MHPAPRLSAIYERCAQLGYTSDALTASHTLHAPAQSADALQRVQVLHTLARAPLVASSVALLFVSSIKYRLLTLSTAAIISTLPVQLRLASRHRSCRI